ncbi:MAG: hypothetical protein HAW67_06785, partial [Endozoicomonadaceae bacterium]|nr:hypothetical protein [Endozoicomonadaceae bacterium]
MAISSDMNNINLESVQKRWAPFLDNEAYGKIQNPEARAMTALAMENMATVAPAEGHESFSRDDQYFSAARALMESEVIGESVGVVDGNNNVITEAAPVTSGGTGIGLGGLSGAGTGTIAGYDPVMIPIVRRALPRMISYEVCGVQGMKMPTQLIFAMKSKATNSRGQEILFHEADTRLTGDFNTYAQTTTVTAEDETLNISSGAATAGVPGSVPLGQATSTITAGGLDAVIDASTGKLKLMNGEPLFGAVVGGFDTANAERTGRDGNGDPTFAKITFSIERTSVVAEERQVETEYSIELAQDLKAVHGMDAEKELASI